MGQAAEDGLPHLPLGLLAATVRYQSQKVHTKLGWGTHKGSEYSLERKDASFSSSVPIGAHSALGLTLGLSQSQVEDIGYRPQA